MMIVVGLFPMLCVLIVGVGIGWFGRAASSPKRKVTP